MIKDYYTELSRSNYWLNAKFNRGILRSEYLNNINSYIGNKLIKVLVGQRGVGKSYLLHQLAERLINQGVLAKNILIINRTFTDTGLISTSQEIEDILNVYLEHINPIGKVYVFIEEIHNIEDWEQLALKLSLDNTYSYELFATCSSKSIYPDSDGKVNKSFVFFEVFPFTYTDYLRIERKDNDKKSYLSYINNGYQLPTISNNTLYYSSLKDTILFRDIIQKYRIKDPLLLEKVFLYLIRNISEFVTIGTIVNYFSNQKQKPSYETIANYINYLEESYLIYRVERFQIKSKDTISGSCKYYVNSWNLVASLYSIFKYDQDTILRNQIYLDLLQFGFQVKIGLYKTHIIDFMAQKADRVIYFQCVSSLIDKSILNSLYKSLEAINDNYEKFIVSLDDEQLPSKDGIRHIQAWNIHQIL